MGLRIHTNIASLTAQRNLHAISSRLMGNYARLSSGLRIASAADDPAGLGISERMRAQIRSYSAAGRNAQDGISLVQTAEGALGEVSNLLGRLRELAVQAANGTLSSDDRATIDAEATSLLQEIERIADSTSFNGIDLLNAAATRDIQVGIHSGQAIGIALGDMQTIALGIDDLSVDLSSAAGASAAMALFDDAIGTVSTARGALGAAQLRLESAFRSIRVAGENLSAAESRIRDVDFAYETAALAKNMILQQAAAAVLAQANLQPMLALSLLP